MSNHLKPYTMRQHPIVFTTNTAHATTVQNGGVFPMDVIEVAGLFDENTPVNVLRMVRLIRLLKLGRCA